MLRHHRAGIRCRLVEDLRHFWQPERGRSGGNGAPFGRGERCGRRAARTGLRATGGARICGWVRAAEEFGRGGYAWSASLSSTPAPVRGRASTEPVSELRRNSRPDTPDRVAAFVEASEPSAVRGSSGSVTFVPAVTYSPASTTQS